MGGLTIRLPCRMLPVGCPYMGYHRSEVKGAMAKKFEKSERFEMRISSEFLRDVDQWRLHQPDQPSRAAAIRQLVEIQLKQFGTNLGPVKKSKKKENVR
jgi:hypothetical protein